MQAGLLALVLASLLAGVTQAISDEFGDVFDGGKLSRFCLKHCEACDATDVSGSLHRIQDLEGVEADLITWRTHWIGSTLVALAILVCGIACGLAVATLTLLVLVTFFASSFAFRHQESWHAGHVLKHTREARRHCLKKLLGAPLSATSYYGQ